MRISTSIAILTLGLVAPAVGARQKQPIERADQLPVHSYAVPKPPSALLHDDTALAALADSLRRDLEADLAAYEILDRAALRAHYRALETITMLQHRADDALAYEEKARPLEEKPAERILSGMTVRPLIAAERSGAAGASKAFSTAYAAELGRMPYDSVQAELKITRQRLALLTPAFLEGAVASQLDPAARGGRISADVAMQLLNRAYTLQRVLPYRDEMTRQLSAMIAAHHVEKPDIWALRDVSLEGRPGLTPVVLAIWDSGVDATLFPRRVWTNTKEIARNQKDDDGNGFVDDVHGIAWSWNGEPRSGDLRALELSPTDLARAKENINGFMDIQNGIDSPDAERVRRLVAGLAKDQMKPLIESVQFYATYAHGTHVAGIATGGNPAARILVARFEAPYRLVSPAPTPEWAAGFGKAAERAVAYYRKAGVRVVNLSWAMAASQLEHELEMNGVGADAAERRRLAIQCFDIVKNALRTAIEGAQEILFVCAAGNSNESNQFNEAVPASLDLPNTITVGAVDQAGDEAAFTSFGKVDLYANGFSVESLLPGGEKHRWSGTSMAAPQVVNLAAKLWAVHPRLSVEQVRELILDGADKKDVSGRTIRLLNEEASFQRMAAAAER